MSWQWLQKLPEFMRSDFAKFIYGVASGVAVLAWAFRGWVRSAVKAAKLEIEAKDNLRTAEREKERADSQREIFELKSRHGEGIIGMQEEVREAHHCQAEAESELEKMTTELVALQARLAALESFDGKQWEQDTHTQPPSFVNATERQTRFISIINLKGGVGKTTLTANIGVSLARRKHRVLLVDLDFQGSLTRLCTSSLEQLKEIIEKRRTVARLLNGEGDSLSVGELTHRVTHLNLVGHTCDFIGASEGLAEAEAPRPGTMAGDQNARRPFPFPATVPFQGNSGSIRLRALRLPAPADDGVRKRAWVLGFRAGPSVA